MHCDDQSIGIPRRKCIDHWFMQDPPMHWWEWMNSMHWWENDWIQFNAWLKDICIEYFVTVFWVRIVEMTVLGCWNCIIKYTQNVV